MLLPRVVLNGIFSGVTMRSKNCRQGCAPSNLGGVDATARGFANAMQRASSIASLTIPIEPRNLSKLPVRAAAGLSPPRRHAVSKARCAPRASRGPSSGERFPGRGHGLLKYRDALAPAGQPGAARRSRAELRTCSARKSASDLGTPAITAATLSDSTGGGVGFNLVIKFILLVPPFRFSR